MVYHDQKRIVAVGDGEVSDKVHGDLLEGVGAFGGDRGKGGNGGMHIRLVGLACGTFGNEFVDKGGHAGPPVILLKKRNSVEIPAMGACQGFMTSKWQAGSQI